jgi:hypothetical protein
MDEFELEDQGDNNPFGDVNQNELLANLINYNQVRLALLPGGLLIATVVWRSVNLR